MRVIAVPRTTGAVIRIGRAASEASRAFTVVERRANNQEPSPWT
jgi:hypothetical protein